jgi:alkylation response protein AidB-like acyl-CoA dehydrogenase
MGGGRMPATMERDKDVRMTILDPAYTERQARFVALAAQLADTIAPRAAAYDRENIFPFADFNDLAAAGYLALTVPEEAGGMGANLGEFVRAQQRLAQGNGSVALGSTMTLSTLGREAQFHAWPENIRERVFAAGVREGATINSVATEPELGSPSRGGRPRTTARQVEGGWLINGRKTWSSLSPILTFFIVLAAVEGSEETGDFLVTRGARGLSIVETWDSLGMRATGSHDVLLEDVFVPDADVVRFGGVRRGADPGASDHRAWGALAVSGTYLGIAEAARAVAIQYATDRVPPSLGKPLATLPAIQAKVGEIDIALLTARGILWAVADEWDATRARRPGFPGRVAAAKYVATNTAIEVVDKAMRIVGGASLSRDLPLERYYRDVRAGLHNPPMDDMTLTLVGKGAFERT